MEHRRIEIIAIGKQKIYSIGTVTISNQGDVYHNMRIRGSDFHISRHASGETHWKSKKTKFSETLYKGVPVKEFRGFELLGNSGCCSSLDSLPELYKEYKMKKCNGVFCIDMREYECKAFNLQIAMLTKEGLESLLSNSTLLNRRQIYIYPDTHPMIAITAGEANIPAVNSSFS